MTRRMHRPRRNTLATAGVLVAAVAAGAYAADGVLGTDSPANDILNGINYIPNGATITWSLGRSGENALNEAREDLIALIDSQGTDRGIKIRAFRALQHFPSRQTEVALVAAIEQHQHATQGISILYLRSAMLSYGFVAKSRARLTLEAQLRHPSRDVRATAAEALAIAGDCRAKEALAIQHNRESSEQVLVALREAQRSLEDCFARSD